VDDRVLLLSASTGDVAFQDKSSLSRGSHLTRVFLVDQTSVCCSTLSTQRIESHVKEKAKYIKKERK